MDDFRFDIVLRNLPFLLEGARLTIVITLISMSIGMVVGLIAALARLSRFRVPRWLSSLYIDFFRSTPLLVQLVWFFFVLPIIIGYSITAFTAGTIALSLYVGAYLAEIYRAGIRSIEAGQREAAMALGMTSRQAMRRIILPQAVVRMLPPFGSMFVTLFKESALVSAIGVADLLRRGLSLSQVTVRPVEVLTVTALIYLVLTYVQTIWVNALHRRYLSH
jgi:polar amino acid transport system permease protein